MNDPVEAALATGRSLRKAGNFAGALGAFNGALALARTRDNPEQIVRCQLLVATVQLLSFQYGNAMAASREALALAQKARLFRLAGGAAGTIASIYELLGDFGASEVEGKRAIDLLKKAPASEPQTREFLVKALQIQATLCYLRGKIGEGEEYSSQTLLLAQQLGDKSLEALSWDVRGIALLRDGQFSAAEKSLLRASALRSGGVDVDALAVSKEHLAELELSRRNPDYSAALKLIDEAFSSNSVAFRVSPQYYPIHIRGKILLAAGHPLKALQEFRRAVNAAEIWRQGAPPGDTTNTQTVSLLHEVYRDFAHLAAQISLEQNDRALREEAWQVLAANRSASLREQLTRALANDAKMSGNYLQTLAALQGAQARVTLGRNSQSEQAELAKIRTDIRALENQVQPSIGKNYFSGEKFLRKNSLRDIQARLGHEQLLLSFSLGETKSYLWAITGEQMSLYQIDGAEQISAKALQLTHAVREGSAAVIKDAAQKAGQSLFGVLPASLAKKAEWLIVADGALANGVPFGVLPAGPLGQTGEWLLDKHSLRVLPSELLLSSPRSKAGAERFVGIADPIYNQADSRLSGTRVREPGTVEASSISLARLAGSGREVRAAAQLSGFSDRRILEGLQASAQSLRQALDEPPQLLHFAVHVVSPPQSPQEAALALSVRNGVPELLTSEEIATLRLPGCLVVMSGCSSNQGKAVPSAGLLGLSRAWLLAGAQAVIASSWPTPDDSGKFFSSFYSHLRAAPAGSLSRRAAFALAQAQMELQRGSGYASLPRYWAAYSIVSKE